MKGKDIDFAELLKRLLIGGGTRDYDKIIVDGQKVPGQPNQPGEDMGRLSAFAQELEQRAMGAQMAGGISGVPPTPQQGPPQGQPQGGQGG